MLLVPQLLSAPFSQLLRQLEIHDQNVPAMASQIHTRGESFKSSLKKPWVRVMVIFGFAAAFSFIAAWTGCFIASRHGKRRSIRRANKFSPKKQTPEIKCPPRCVVSSSDNSAEDDIEMLAQLDSIIGDRTMANQTFQGRELDVFRREMRQKTKRQARGGMRTSQGINLPVNVHQLKGKMRSIIRSMTRSDAVQEPIPELQTLATVLASTNTHKTRTEDTTFSQRPRDHSSVDEPTAGQVAKHSSGLVHQIEGER